MYHYEATWAGGVVSIGEVVLSNLHESIRVRPSRQEKVVDKRCVAVVKKAREQVKKMTAYREGG